MPCAIPVAAAIAAISRARGRYGERARALDEHELGAIGGDGARGGGGVALADDVDDREHTDRGERDERDRGGRDGDPVPADPSSHSLPRRVVVRRDELTREKRAE